MKRIILRKGEEERIFRGHPWVYDNEVRSILEGKGAAERPVQLFPGELADVESCNKHGEQYVGRALVNPASKIIARMISPSKEGVDTGFFKRRIREAAERRSRLGIDLASVSCRLVFAEADFIPGLIIDSFIGWSLDDIQKTERAYPLVMHTLSTSLGSPQKILSIQILTFALDMRTKEILQAMNEVLPALLEGEFAVIEKVSLLMREKEKIPEREAITQGVLPANGIVIFEHGLPFIVDLEGGQKTGHYLDQRDNRQCAFRYGSSGGKRVLDAFCYSGGFAIHAARAGAEEVIAADSSKNALSLVAKNALLNGVADRIKTVQADIFELLAAFERAKETFDMIILDPPAFAASRTSLESALKGYKEINLKALKMLKRGGVLISCSCSHAVSESHFKRMILDAAHDAGRRLVQNEFRTQAGDHPILLGYDESHYLKCGVYTVVD
ncbi:MAG: class I SAM-dependent rRNA methyltransferase [Spirochaetaceae bacterium]|jgi:23S rRNA (cytosine1962-C5)-methyltransferase|nr:class I SAM-dependent rRNA methyltransferase [Spirochaetaceae bacterium]